MILGRSPLGTLRAILGALFPSASTTGTVEAYLDDFADVPAVGRFFIVEAQGRWFVVPATGREFLT